MPGTANCSVPRLRAQPGSLLSLLPVRNVKDQPVGGSRREQRAHARTHGTTLSRDSYTHILGPGSCGIMRAPARPSHEASAEIMRGPPLGRRCGGQVELRSGVTAQLLQRRVWKGACANRSARKANCTCKLRSRDKCCCRFWLRDTGKFLRRFFLFFFHFFNGAA